jgi:glycosyltransferase involved in cell wall biosynthesis
VVRHNENGLLVPPRDSRALAAALRMLIDDRQLRRSMGQKGRTFAQSELSLEKVINEHFKLYEKFLND